MSSPWPTTQTTATCLEKSPRLYNNAKKHKKSRLCSYLKELTILKLLLTKIFYDQRVLVCFEPKLVTLTPSRWILEGDSYWQGGEKVWNWGEEENRVCEEGGESENMWRGGGVGSGRKTPPRCLNFDFTRWRLPFTQVCLMLLYRITCVVYFQKGFYNV